MTEPTIHPESQQKAYAKTYCRVCGRVLTHFESVARGIGPVCYQKQFGTSPSRVRKKHRNARVQVRKRKARQGPILNPLTSYIEDEEEEI